jgi:hypothetical protein
MLLIIRTLHDNYKRLCLHTLSLYSFMDSLKPAFPLLFFNVALSLGLILKQVLILQQ